MKSYLLSHWHFLLAGLVGIFASVMLTLTGCTLLRERPAAVRLAVSYATAKYIEASDRPAERALRVRDVATKVAQFIESSPDILVDQLRNVAIANLPPGLGMADRTLALAVIDTVAEEIQARIKSGALPEDVKMNARSVVQWVAAAAIGYLPNS